MKKLHIVFFTIFLVIISGCSTGFNSIQVGTAKQPTSGVGLEMSFNVNDNFISSGRLTYDLELKNSGLEPIKLSRDNFKLYTLEKMDDGSDVFTQSSLDDFYNTLLKKDAIYHAEDISGIHGSLEIKKSYFDNITNNLINYVLAVNYKYKTSFSNNVNINLNSNSIMSVTDTLGQAAPVKVTKIMLVPYSDNNYILQYYLSDGGPSFSNKFAKITGYNFKFRGQDLNNCKVLTSAGNSFKEISNDNIFLNSKQSQVIIACMVDLSNIDKNTPIGTTTSGVIDYNYNVEIDGTIDLPKQRGNYIKWN